MQNIKNDYRVLVVSGGDKLYNYIKQILPKDKFEQILKAKNAGEAKRILFTVVCPGRYNYN